MKHFIFLMIICLPLAACQPGNAGNPEAGLAEPMPEARVSGTVSYRERILLRPGTRLAVVLEDVSRADTPARQIASLELTDPGQIPIAFELEYNPADIDERMTYALRARILAADGSLMFINDTHTPVITRDAGNHADMVLVSAGRKSPAAGKPETADDLAESTTGMDLKGQFSYLADAAWFRDCSSGKTFPVEMSHQVTELERAYFNSGIKSGDGLTVKLRGRYLARPDIDTNTNEVSLIVDTFENISDPQDCVPEHHADLRGTYWKLLDLAGKSIKPAPNQREAHLVLQGESNRVNGQGGCNSFFGSYILNGTDIEFSGMGSTMMTCIEGMETEQSFLLALSEANRVRVEGQFMELYKNEVPLARFEAVYF